VSDNPKALRLRVIVIEEGQPNKTRLGKRAEEGCFGWLTNAGGSTEDVEGGSKSERQTSRAAVGQQLGRQRHERIVQFHVALENVGTRSEQTFESRSIQLDTLEGSAGNDSGSSWPVQQQSDLAEVIVFGESTDFFALFALVALLIHDRLTVFDDVKVVAFFALFNDHLSVRELARNESVGDRQTFPFVQIFCSVCKCRQKGSVEEVTSDTNRTL
jgi:hypothetical protein